MNSTDFLLSEDDLRSRFHEQYGDVKKHGWRVRMRHWFSYFEPDMWYEALVERLVTKDCSWIDVGGGKGLFPQNKHLSTTLVQRCAFLAGVDPSDNILLNPYVTEQAKCTIEQYSSNRSYDLATLRMVAEHIQEPKKAIESLSRLIKPGGRVVIYTPNRYSPVSIAAAIIPYSLHHTITSLLWQTKEEDVFPTFYRMNTRKRLRALFLQSGFKEVSFVYLDNCNTFQRFHWSCFLELTFRSILRVVGFHYPENNLLGVYEKFCEKTVPATNLIHAITRKCNSCNP